MVIADSTMADHLVCEINYDETIELRQTREVDDEHGDGPLQLLKQEQSIGYAYFRVVLFLPF